MPTVFPAVGLETSCEDHSDCCGGALIGAEVGQVLSWEQFAASCDGGPVVPVLPEVIGGGADFSMLVVVGAEIDQDACSGLQALRAWFGLWSWGEDVLNRWLDDAVPEGVAFGAEVKPVRDKERVCGGRACGEEGRGDVNVVHCRVDGGDGLYALIDGLGSVPSTPARRGGGDAEEEDGGVLAEVLSDALAQACEAFNDDGCADAKGQIIGAREDHYASGLVGDDQVLGSQGDFAQLTAAETTLQGRICAVEARKVFPTTSGGASYEEK